MMALASRPKIHVLLIAVTATLMLLLYQLQRGSDERRKQGSGEPGHVKTMDTTAGTGRRLDVKVEFVDELAREGVVVDDGKPFDEPPALTDTIEGEWVQRCSNSRASFRAEDFEHGAVCGGPLSEPCFDRSRCQAQGGPKIYVYDQECSEADSKDLPNTNHTGDDLQHQDSYWVDAVRSAGMLAETYEEACLFIHVNTHNHDAPCAIDATLWNGGANHVMMQFTPWWKPWFDRPSVSNTYAMDWAFDSLSCYYRSGFDLSVPLRPVKIFPEYESTPSTARKYFLTFKGTLYLRGFGLEERSAVSRVHDPANRIVSVVKCSTMHGDELLPENKDYCDRSRQRHRMYDYGKLMNTTFALVPSGRSPGTYRLGEAMSAGAIPVFVVRDWIKPFQEMVDWSSFSFVFSPDDVRTVMVDTLRAVSAGELEEMQRKSLEAYWKIFGGVTDYSVIAANTIDVLTRRLEFHR